MIKKKILVDIPVPELSDRIIEQLNTEIEKNFIPVINRIEKNVAAAEQAVRELKVSAFDLISESPEAYQEVKTEIERLDNFISQEREKQAKARRKISAIKSLAEKLK